MITKLRKHIRKNGIKISEKKIHNKTFFILSKCCENNHESLIMIMERDRKQARMLVGCMKKFDRCEDHSVAEWVGTLLSPLETDVEMVLGVPEVIAHSDAWQKYVMKIP